jgi:hypothetical protein
MKSRKYIYVGGVVAAAALFATVGGKTLADGSTSRNPIFAVDASELSPNFGDGLKAQAAAWA